MIKNMAEAIELHKETFGVEPVFTGMSAMDSKPPIQLVMEAIERGEPYVDEPVPDGAIV